MRKIAVTLSVILLLISNICFAASTEYLYTDALGTEVNLVTESVRPITYKIRDCYKATKKLVFNKPMGNIKYSQMYYLINKENKDYAVVYIENYDVNDKRVSSTDKGKNIHWSVYDPTDNNYKLVDRVFEIAK